MARGCARSGGNERYDRGLGSQDVDATVVEKAEGRLEAEPATVEVDQDGKSLAGIAKIGKAVPGSYARSFYCCPVWSGCDSETYYHDHVASLMDASSSNGASCWSVWSAGLLVMLRVDWLRQLSRFDCG
ncbi:hypothetical protein Nepgr_010253 [Nepenthes gracilis]|uniref:Uncharacterized protein n=1 Tax=Nepenthes gracilis TaxID=150966 RepID=A0AAD3XKV6_NEPGR|nr:hypothetical protein Nepgr_010253 [Nepenthes gracilis]